VPALPQYIIEPIWEQFAALLPERKADHPLGCHRPRVPDGVVFEKLVQVLVFGCAYWRIADGSCSATTLRRRRDEWIETGAMDTLEEMVREAYDQIIGLELDDMAVDCCIQRRLPAAGRWRAEARWTGENGASNAQWPSTPMASRSGSSLLPPIATTRRSCPRLWIPSKSWTSHPSRRACTSTAATTRISLASGWQNVA
jgi:transposase